MDAIAKGAGELQMKKIFGVMLCVFGLSAGAGAAETAKPYKIKWVLAHEPVRVFERAARFFSEAVSKDTNGQVQVEVVDSRELNNGKPMSADRVFELLKKGEIQMSQTYTTYLGNHANKMWVLDLPFLFKNHEHAAKVLDGPVGQQIVAGLEKSNLKGLAFTYSGGYMIIPSTKKPISKVEDFKGLKVRVNGNSPVGTALMKSLGAEPFTVSNETTATNKLDGFETTFARLTALPSDTQESSKYLNATNHSIFLTSIVVNKEFFEKMPQEYQKAVRQAALKAAAMEREESIKDSETARAEFSKKGHQIVEMDKKEVERFKMASRPVYQKFEKTFGKDLIESIEKQQ